MSDITLEQARTAVTAAIERAKQLGVKMNIAIVDTGANLKAFARMDGSFLGSIDIAIKKARTAKLFDFPTSQVGKLSQPGGPFYQIELTNGGLVSFPGGLPIKNAAGEIIGAIGVSGGAVEQDETVAEAGAKSAAQQPAAKQSSQTAAARV